MKIRAWLVFLSVSLALSVAYAERKSSVEPLFHPPQTEAEKAVDEIVKMSIAKPDMFFIILQNPSYDLSKTKEFEPYFTGAFMIAWRRFEKILVDQYCGGQYQTGKKCGYDINPIACSDPLPGPYSYRTIMGDDVEMLITLATQNDLADKNTYYMQREEGRWKLGGLYCEMEIPDTIPEKHLMKKFRQPKYESEKKLEEILQVARTSKDIIPFVFDLSWRDRKKDGRFSRLFTPALLRAWKDEAVRITEHFCSDSYRETGTGACDLFDNPVSCDISEIDLFVVRTTFEAGNKSVIIYSYPGRRREVRFAFHMSKEPDGWRLSGVDCNDFRGFKFNMP